MLSSPAQAVCVSAGATLSAVARQKIAMTRACTRQWWRGASNESSTSTGPGCAVLMPQGQQHMAARFICLHMMLFVLDDVEQVQLMLLHLRGAAARSRGAQTGGHPRTAALSYTVAHRHSLQYAFRL